MLAAEKKRCNSHNCAQSVVCTYCDLVGLPEQTALDIAGAYGTGMGNMEGTCGALVGAGMIVGLATKDRNLSRARMKQLMEKFQERNGATQCRLLKGIGSGKPLRECPDCVADACHTCVRAVDSPFSRFFKRLLFTLSKVKNDLTKRVTKILVKQGIAGNLFAAFFTRSIFE